MKILQFVADGAPGGGTNHVMQLLKGLGANYENVLLTQKDTYLFDLAKSNGIKVIGGDFFRGRFDRAAIATVREAIADERPALVHCHGGRAGFFRSFLSREIPTTYTVHGFHHAQKSLVPKTMGWVGEYWTMRRMDHVFFVSDYDRQLAVRQRLLPRTTSFRVVHNGIAPLKPNPTSERLGVGFIGRFVYQKNPELFLDVVERMPDQKFVMAGGGELDEKIRADVNSRGLEDRVELLGSLDHRSALEFISKLDVLVMTPRWEGLPLLPLEAMFMKVPVVSTAVGGIPEVIQHGETGMLSASENADELAGHISDIIADKKLRDSIVENAFERAHKHFSQDAMLTQIRDSYVRTLSCESTSERVATTVRERGQQSPGV